MPKTVIIRQTWRCPTCDSEWDSSILDGKTCSHCGQGVVRRETNPARCGTLSIMGEEEIDGEIEERTEATFRARRLAEVDTEIASLDAEGEFPTAVVRERRRAERKADVEQRIARLRQQEASDPTEPTFRPQGYFLATPADAATYRVRRQADIAAAIIAARMREHRP